MLRKLLLFILLFLLAILLWNRTSISFPYYYGKGKSAYYAEQYDQAVKYLERALSVKSEDSAGRLYYAYSLAKLEPNYYVQRALYEISQSKYNDPASQYAKQEIISIRKKLMKDLEDNYIYNALSGQDIVRWSINSFPLKVYIKNPNDVPNYYIEKLTKAMEQWTNRTGFIKFEIIQNEKDANIFIEFKDSDIQCSKDEKCNFSVAQTSPLINSGNILKRMYLSFTKTNPFGQNYTPQEIFNTSLHELGHTLGIMGHSDNSSDVMYASNDKTSDIYALYRSEQQYLTMRDLKTMALLYHLDPSVTNVRGYSKTNLYYPEIILGSSDELLEKKLIELIKYIKNYPNLPAGYINISSVYASMGDTDMAFTSLKQAELRAQSEDEKYLINYNRAILHFNLQQYSEALKYANIAKTFKQSGELDHLIEDINKFSEY